MAGDILHEKRTVDGSGQTIIRKFYHRNQEVSRDRLLRLIDDAERFHQSFVWQVLSDDCRYQMEQMAIEESENFDAVLQAKAAILVLNTIEERITELANIKDL
jgi:hypothetical protein